jgi:hypothetical protein
MPNTRKILIVDDDPQLRDALGYREISLDRLGGSNTYLAIFAPPSVASRTPPEAIVACKSP